MIPCISSFLSRHLLDRAGGHRRKVLMAYAAKKSFEFLIDRRVANIKLMHWSAC